MRHYSIHKGEDREYPIHLREAVSKVVVGKSETYPDAGIIIRDCKQAEVVQKDWRK